MMPATATLLAALLLTAAAAPPSPLARRDEQRLWPEPPTFYSSSPGGRWAAFGAIVETRRLNLPRLCESGRFQALANDPKRLHGETLRHRGS